jgi:ferredoxin-NADP reductase
VTADAAAWLVATVADDHRVSSHGRILRLKVPRWPGNLAGQHVDLRLTAEDGYQAVRSYSIATSGPGELIELAVDEVADGEVSPYLVEDVIVGDQVEIRGPIGAYFVWTPERDEPVQLIAGGSGIVPLVAMARAHAASGSTAPMRLLYSVRSPADAFYADDLARLAADDAFDLDWAYTRTAPPGTRRPVGRVDGDTLAASTIGADRHPLVFVCGPTGFVEAVANLLLAAGHPADRVRTERFGGA